MFYWTPKGKAIEIFNKRPRNLSGGGMIKDYKGNKHPNEDTVSSYLAYGDLVIPKSVMESGVMKDYHGGITGPVEHDRSKLGKTIVLPNEMVIHKRYAKGAEKYLKKHGIVLPLDK